MVNINGKLHYVKLTTHTDEKMLSLIGKRFYGEVLETLPSQGFEYINLGANDKYTDYVNYSAGVCLRFMLDFDDDVIIQELCGVYFCPEYVECTEKDLMEEKIHNKAFMMAFPIHMKRLTETGNGDISEDEFANFKIDAYNELKRNGEINVQHNS